MTKILTYDLGTFDVFLRYQRHFERRLNEHRGLNENSNLIVAMRNSQQKLG